MISLPCFVLNNPPLSALSGLRPGGAWSAGWCCVAW
jgi:hypothetical protein